MAWYNNKLDLNHYRQEYVDEMIDIPKKIEVKMNEQEIQNMIYYDNAVSKLITTNNDDNLNDITNNEGKHHSLINGVTSIN